MSLAWKQVKVYLRLLLVVTVAAAVGLVLFKNRANEVPVWFFGLTDPAKKLNVVWLMLLTALATITTWRALAFARGLWKDLRELHRLEETKELERRQELRTAELELRERQLAEKLKEAAGDGDSVSPRE